MKKARVTVTFLIDSAYVGMALVNGFGRTESYRQEQEKLGLVPFEAMLSQMEMERVEIMDGVEE